MMTELNLNKIRLNPEVVQIEVNSSSSQEEIEVLEALVISVSAFVCVSLLGVLYLVVCLC